ncbi:hypothetical protein [Knoellia remsis]|uniref:hypothetical protein n=1 Tax=Knoellia remsis TaxID=407159 RepID=UPI000D048792|nr:hypothetical protein [Knoellia remsis]
MPGDSGSLAAAGTSARRAARDLEAARERSGAAYDTLRSEWSTSTSVRVRKEGARALDVLAEGSGHADRVGALLQEHATRLSELQARSRRLLDDVAAAGLEVEDGVVRLPWGVIGEADAAAARGRADDVRAFQGELDAILAQHRRRRDALLEQVAASTAELEGLARALRLS